jgi:putative hemolysin
MKRLSPLPGLSTLARQGRQAAIALLACFSLSLSAAFFSVSAQAAVEIEAPSVPLHTIHFVGGRLVQDLDNFDVWTEYDFRGTERYQFRTKSYDTQSLRLINDTGRVELLIRLDAKTISGQWPGHPMAQLYRVTKIDPIMTAAQEMNGNPVERMPPPNYSPPGKKVPAPNPAKKMPNPDTLTRAAYQNGAFEKRGAKTWIERSESGQIFEFQQIGHDNESIYLFDMNRQILIELDIRNSMSRISHNGDRLKKLYTLTALSAQTLDPVQIPSDPLTPPTSPTPAPPPESDRTLSAEDRAMCVSQGGFVERAGILGAERCTMTYSDGGNICIDSSNCQGKCVTGVGGEDSNAVNGQCQKTNNPFGCYSEVLGGKVQPGLCVD